jgi:hypothetical protein
MNFPKPRTRSEDSGITPVWRARAVSLATKGFFLLLGIVATVAGIRVIPGGIVVGSLQDVHQLALRVDSTDHALMEQHQAMMAMDTTHQKEIRQLERSVILLTDMQKAQTRDRCGSLGFSRAELLGYPCSEVGFHLPAP